MGALGGFLLIPGELQSICDVNSFDYNDIVFVFFNFSRRRRDKVSFACRNVTRFQRAAKGSRQSAGSGSHDVIERCGVWLVDVGVYVVMFCDFGMHAKLDVSVERGEICSA